MWQPTLSRFPWLDACLTARLPEKIGAPLRSMPIEEAWLTEPTGQKAWKSYDYSGDTSQPVGSPMKRLQRWTEYVTDTMVSDTTPPHLHLTFESMGDWVQWNAKADLESGISHFVIERDGVCDWNVAGKTSNPFGRPVFQNLQYSDTPPCLSSK